MHLTVRMAWHDSGWNGRVCENPSNNAYCVGAYSLLADRIERNRDLEFEQEHCGEEACRLSAETVPPCYWSINAFGEKEIDIRHKHAFSDLNVEPISQPIAPYSVLSWPFKLSFVHSGKQQKKHGNYWPNLDARIQDFQAKFTPGQSIIFFYANYDNPVSADEMKYLLVGCSVISELHPPTRFSFTQEQLDTVHGWGDKMKNFPEMNWALQFTHNPETSVLLPYGKYLAYVEANPEDEEKLADMKVTVDEDSLVGAFKYVAMDMDDDKCLYLLYKMRRSFKKMQEHNHEVMDSDFAEEESRLQSLIEMVWQRRGIYPSLGPVINYFMEDQESFELASALSGIATSKRDVYQILKGLVDGDDVPDELEEYEDLVLDFVEKKKVDKHLRALVRLSLLNLTPHQIGKIVEDADLLERLADNPYVLYESYRADENDLDDPDLQDERIDLYKIDVAMIPDRACVKRHRKIQDLREDSPQRIRAVITDYLKTIGGSLGHCYDHMENILASIREQPLIYKTKDVKIDEEAIASPDEEYRSHFLETLRIESHDGVNYVYLDLVRQAEQLVRTVFERLTQSRKDHAYSGKDVQEHINKSIEDVKAKITDLDGDLFREERERLYAGVFKKSFFLITGKPGSGKTFETGNVIRLLHDKGEAVDVLAPTGKAALRLTQNIVAIAGMDIQAQTIDKFIYGHGFSWAYEDWERLFSLGDDKKICLENLVIDESSMVDLEKLVVLLSIVRFDDKYPKRLIMVGDENQLPPIGLGKPFHDIITHVLARDDLFEQHYVNLTSNCRQEFDKNVLRLAEVFTDNKRCFEDALDILSAEGQVSPGLSISRWRTKDELAEALYGTLETVMREDVTGSGGNPEDNFQLMNLFFGLYENGHVNNQELKFRETLLLDKMQVLTPYRSGHYGTIGVNKHVQAVYRKEASMPLKGTFYHADKMIRISNWYHWKTGQLRLSNGSIGVGTRTKWKKYRYFFPDLDDNYPLKYIDSEDGFDLAYAITVHKSQGSDFDIVCLVIPNKLALLCRELIYTALTRSRQRLFLFVQDSMEEEDLLTMARNRSHLQHRNTSVFSAPQDRTLKYQPERGIFVRSRVEFIIYEALKRHNVPFAYEEELKLAGRDYVIHPDFTVRCGDQTIYWEHLGMLDTRKYYRNWMRRKRDYDEHGLLDQLLTTDDLDGIDGERIDRILEDLKSGQLEATKGSKFSGHHYQLYS